ncbi:MAG: porin [Veillonellaceae bacterium]|nr:porin [Veillonellaceae bacterium]
MKKTTLIALCTLLNLAFAPVALADPVELSGDLSLKYQRDHEDGESAKDGLVSTLTLKAKAKLNENTFLYTRLGAQNVSKTQFRDFDTPYYSDGKKEVFALDQFGVIWNKDELTYKLGRQDITVGATALLYSRSDSNIGQGAFADGLLINGNVGNTEISAFFGQEDNYSSDDNRLYAVRAAYSPNDTWTYGATAARYVNKEAGQANTNHLAVDGTYKYGKHNLTAEFAKSNSSVSNKAYAVVWGYDFDGKAAASITGFRVEEQASMGGGSDFDNDNRGIHYGANYQINDALSLEAVYKDQKQISNGVKNNSTEITLNYTF